MKKVKRIELFQWSQQWQVAAAAAAAPPPQKKSFFISVSPVLHLISENVRSCVCFLLFICPSVLWKQCGYSVETIIKCLNSSNIKKQNKNKCVFK